MDLVPVAKLGDRAASSSSRSNRSPPTRAESKRIDVGLAAPDRDEMVYLESIRYSRKVAFRNVVSGQRVPMELTSQRFLRPGARRSMEFQSQAGAAVVQAACRDRKMSMRRDE